MNRLKALFDTAGQAPWLDYVRRDLIESGELKTLVERDGLRGVTSNPSIFEKAIGHNEAYVTALTEIQSRGDQGISALYEELAIADIRSAADVLRLVYDQTNHADGYISLEVSPYLGHNTEATIAEALRLWKSVDRPNLMVKVPATQAGMPAIRAIIGQGLNVNVTLLFAIEAYEQVVEAYLSGLEDFAASCNGNLARVASVASFFVSRIDTAVDKKLAGTTTASGGLHDKVAIANAKLAYLRFKDLFSGPRWERLKAAGAKPQRLLWASTSTKKPELRDTLYVEQLIGRDTVNTMPPATMDAFRDHGEVLTDAVEHGIEEARATLAALEQAGISLGDITQQLVEDGVQQFADAFDGLLGAVAKRRRISLDGEAATFTFEPGSPALATAYEDELERWRKHGLIRKLWSGDKSLWTGADEDHWTGWLDIAEQELSRVADLREFGDQVRADGITDIVLLGMGGSSLGPEVLAETFAPSLHGPRFHMLDSTDPAQIKTVSNAISLKTTLFIVSSKSGSTLEPNIYLSYFLALAKEALGEAAARHFVAVTDPGSSLEAHAKQEGFRSIFHGVKSIGGRYSVLSDFGLVPAAAIGIDTERLLQAAQQMVRSCAADVPPAENTGVQLGVALGIAAKSFGRDKITLVASPGIADVGAWLEQLLAESTGKQGRGLVPVDREKLGTPQEYGQDRFFAYLELAGQADPAQQSAIAALAAAGHPVATIIVKDNWHVAGEFFRWEIATAVAGAVIGINPFDQPDVEASKIKTRALTDEYEQHGSLPEETPIFRANGVALYADKRNADALGRHNNLDGYLRSHLGQVKAGDYVALLAYIERNESHAESLTHMRTVIRDRTKAATCVGFGPRFLHSTGQAYKGGPNSGVFLQITSDDPHDITVPGHKYSFGVVKAAQARGDLGVLEERGRRALRVHLHDVQAGLQELARAVEHATK